MKKAGATLAYSIVIGFVIIVILILISVYDVGNYVVGYRDKEAADRDEIIERIDSFVSANKYLPETLSVLGFAQTACGYEYKGIKFDFIRFGDNEYVIEYTSEDSVLTQYISEERRWTEAPDIYYIELPLNVDTIAAINRISSFEQDYAIMPVIDSISYNELRIWPVSDITQISDSVAYISYLYKDGSKRCEGWIAYFDDPEDDLSNPFGEWKYYDEQGNCYRKFWNYKENGKLIYEIDR